MAGPLPDVPEGWEAAAACLAVPTEVFFPTTGESLDEALAICSGCPVLVPCAVANIGERIGVWGGMSEKRRSELRRRLGIRATPPYHPPLSSHAPPVRLPPAPWMDSTDRRPSRPPATGAPFDALGAGIDQVRAKQDARRRRRAGEAASPGESFG